MTESLRDQMAALANERGEIDAGPNTRALLEQAESEGLVSRIPGRLNMRPPTHPAAIEVSGVSLPCIGGMWDVYRVTPSSPSDTDRKADG
jgi:hypothetical protein